MPSIQVSSITINPVTGVDFVASGTAYQVFRTTQDAWWTYELRSFKRNEDPEIMKDPWQVAAMPWPPEPDAGNSTLASGLFIKQGVSWANTSIFDYNTTGNPNLHNPQTYEYSSFTPGVGNQGLGTCGIIRSDGPGVAQREKRAGDQASSVTVMWDKARVAWNVNPYVIDGTDGGTAATTFINNFIKTSEGYDKWWDEPSGWYTWYEQGFEYDTSSFGCNGSTSSMSYVRQDNVPGNGLWRDDLVQ
jgi:hypothetical protein